MTGAQAREARRLLGWSIQRLSLVCGISLEAIRMFEATGEMPPSMFKRTNPVDRVVLMRKAFEASGITFAEDGQGGPGVQLLPRIQPLLRAGRRWVRSARELPPDQDEPASDILPSQVRAARGLLAWSQERLGEASGVAMRTLNRLELEQGTTRRSTLAAIRTALETAGVVFTDGEEPGVKLRKSEP